MKNSVNDIYNFYTTKKKMFDKDAINYLLNYMANELNVSEYIESCSFYSSNNVNSYSLKDKLLNVDIDYLNRIAFDLEPISKPNVNNFSTLLKLYYELEKISQIKKVSLNKADSNEEKLELEVLKYALSYLDYNNKYFKHLTDEEKEYLNSLNIGSKNSYNNHRWYNYYNELEYLFCNDKFYNPSERIAQINSVNDLRDKFPNDLYETHMFDRLYISKLIHGYRYNTKGEKITPPTYAFLREINREDGIFELQSLVDEFDSSISDNKKIELGLDVSKEKILELKSKYNFNR